jgi:hypothetical protein
VIHSSGTPIGFTAGTCGVPGVGVETIGVDSDRVFWTFQAHSQPRQNYINHALTQITVQVSTGQYADLGEAESVAMGLLIGLAKAELALAQRKAQALAELGLISQSPSGSRINVDHVQEFWREKIEALAELGEEQLTEQLVDTIQDELGLPLEEISESFSELSELVETMQNATELFNLLSNADAPMSDTDRIRAVARAFDLARSLGPGGPMVTAIGPFLDFYSKALSAIADALDVIDELRKEQILSTGDCSIIEAIIADQARKKAWQNACKVRKLLQLIRDP